MTFLSRLRSTAADLLRPQPADAARPWPAHVLVPAAVCDQTRRGLRSHAPPTADHEGVVYWAGTTDSTLDAAIVLACLVPAADTGPGRFDVSEVAYARVVEAVHDHDLQLFARVHSHPGAWTGHSDKDDEPNLVAEGFYSVVVPNYAVDGVRPFTDCGVHRYEGTGFRQLRTAEVEQTFRTIPTPPTYIDTRTP